MDEPQAYLDGRFIPASTAAVPLTDTGFVMGAAVSEQLRTFAGELFRIDQHLARLEHSLRCVGVDPGMSMERLGEIARELAARNHRLLGPGDDLGLSIFVTPGAHAAYSGPDPPRPLVCLHTYPLPFWLWAEKYRSGQSLVAAEVQQVPGKCWPPELKCRSRMHYYLADRQAAALQPGARALLLDQDGLVTETSTANILIFRSGEGLWTPPLEKVLRGISLGVVIELAGKLGTRWGQRDLRLEDVASADEVLLTSTPVCLLPVTRLNGRPIGGGVPGELFHRLLAAWNDLVGVNIVQQALRFATGRI